jgi:hypothetical protein
METCGHPIKERYRSLNFRDDHFPHEPTISSFCTTCRTIITDFKSLKLCRIYYQNGAHEIIFNVYQVLKGPPEHPQSLVVVTKEAQYLYPLNQVEHSLED